MEGNKINVIGQGVMSSKEKTKQRMMGYVILDGKEKKKKEGFIDKKLEGYKGDGNLQEP